MKKHENDLAYGNSTNRSRHETSPLPEIGWQDVLRQVDDAKRRRQAYITRGILGFLRYCRDWLQKPVLGPAATV